MKTYYFVTVLLLIFMMGAWCYSMGSLEEYMETISGQGNIDLSNPTNTLPCPDLLIKKDNLLLLYNTKLPLSDSNPLPFTSLQDYITYMKNINGSHGYDRCPLLMMQSETDAQGNDTYRLYKESNGGFIPAQIPVTEYDTQQGNPDNPLPFIDANKELGAYNQGGYQGFDPSSFYVGKYTTIDRIHDSTWMDNPTSANAMDATWGGQAYTQQLIDNGVYADNNVYAPRLTTKIN